MGKTGGITARNKRQVVRLCREVVLKGAQTPHDDPHRGVTSRICPHQPRELTKPLNKTRNRANAMTNTVRSV